LKLRNKRYSVSRWLLFLALACTVFLGFYIGHYEVDRKPTPRSLLNLGGSYLESGDMLNALKYWRICALYNEIYGTNYDYDTYPEGKYIKTCRDNLSHIIVNEPLLRRGK